MLSHVIQVWIDMLFCQHFHFVWHSLKHYCAPDDSSSCLLERKQQQKQNKRQETFRKCHGGIDKACMLGEEKPHTYILQGGKLPPLKAG